jgi:hypothetical protein
MYIAHTLNVLIASPGDTGEYRNAIRTTILKWNDSNSQYYQVTLLPVMWETHTFPALGRTQGVVNDQIVADADILIGTFWSRLGTPTIVAESGTVEEIAQFEQSGRPVLLYFCEAPVAILALDTEEIERVKTYRQQMQGKALVGSYVSTDELGEKVREDLTRLIRKMKEQGKIPPLPSGKESVTGAEPSQAPGSDAAPEVAASPEEKLKDLREILIGYRAKWQAQFASIDAIDPSIDRRKDLMSEASGVIWEVVQRVAVRCPEAAIQTLLTSLASTADELVHMQIYLDGGRSFDALNDGCRKVIEGVGEGTAEPWECGG